MSRLLPAEVFLSKKYGPECWLSSIEQSERGVVAAESRQMTLRMFGSTHKSKPTRTARLPNDQRDPPLADMSSIECTDPNLIDVQPSSRYPPATPYWASK